MMTFYYVVAAQAFMESEPLDEVLEERVRNYNEREKAIDFAYVTAPACFETAPLAERVTTLDKPLAAVISSDQNFIRWLKLRLEFVDMGEFEAESLEAASCSVQVA
ncbi:MAG: DUF2488 family protein [Synechococcaceae cyanobacterium SM2_3_60]|nr:DUF2488 family protein [Synechococcaceae cyanobacterium SM2_3_60]